MLYKKLSAFVTNQNIRVLSNLFLWTEKKKKRHVSLKQLAKRFKCTKVITKNKRFLKNMFNLKLGEKERLVAREELGRGEHETESGRNSG